MNHTHRKESEFTGRAVRNIEQWGVSIIKHSWLKDIIYLHQSNSLMNVKYTNKLCQVVKIYTLSMFSWLLCELSHNKRGKQENASIS